MWSRDLPRIRYVSRFYNWDMFRPILAAVATIAMTVSGLAQDSQASFQAIYAALDAAISAKDQDALNRLIAAEAQIHVGPVKLSLRGLMAGEMVKAGLSRRSNVRSVHVEGDSARVVADILYIVESGGKKQESRIIARDTWERNGSGWICRESEQTEGESMVPPTSAAEAKPVIEELKRRAVRLATVEPPAAERDGEFDDLEAFGTAIGGARIVALGEATHGTKEFFLLKERLIEYLVRRKGFSVVAFEMNWVNAEELDRYVKTQDAPRPRLGFDDLTDWMRSENRAGARLSLTGFDMQGAGPAADLVIRYLSRVSPSAAAASSQAYAEARKLDQDHTNVYLAAAAEAARRAESVLTQFDTNKLEWVAKSSPAEWRDARHAAQTAVDSAAMRIDGNGPTYRDRAMARNVEWLADEKYPGQKLILWAHNGHVVSDGDQMGGWLRKRFGAAYYAVGTAYRRGEIWAYGVEGNQNRGIGAWPVAPAPEGSGDAVLSGAGSPLFFLDVRSVPPDGPLGGWLAARHRFNLASGVVLIGKENMVTSVVRDAYDGLMFVEESHAGRPSR